MESNSKNKLDSKPHQRSISSSISMEYNYNPSSNDTYGGTYTYTVAQASGTTFTFTAAHRIALQSIFYIFFLKIN